MQERNEAKRSDVPYGLASMLLLGEGSEATQPYNKNARYFSANRNRFFFGSVKPLSFLAKWIFCFASWKPTIASCSKLVHSFRLSVVLCNRQRYGYPVLLFHFITSILFGDAVQVTLYIQVATLFYHCIRFCLWWNFIALTLSLRYAGQNQIRDYSAQYTLLFDLCTQRFLFSVRHP